MFLADIREDKQEAGKNRGGWLRECDRPNSEGEANMKTSFAFLILLLGSVWTSPVPETEETNEHLLYPYGEAEGDMKNPKDDDGTSPEVPISEPFTFYGKTYHSVYVNNNGVVSFSVPVPEYTPKSIPLVDGKAFVAPYWGDVNNILGGDIFYRETQDPELLRRVTGDINEYFPEIPFTATWAFIATWDHVAYFGTMSRRTNTFQAVLCTNGRIAFIMLNYGDIQWTTGTASEGDPRTGLGGIPAQAGFNSGDDKNYYSIPGSRTPEIINITKTSNVHTPGRWVFQVDDFKVTGVPEELMPKKEEPEVPRVEELEVPGVEEPEVPKVEEPEGNVTIDGEGLPEEAAKENTDGMAFTPKYDGTLDHEDNQEFPEEQSPIESDEESDSCE
ncbi:alpha-tectorin-like isoform X2 [Rhineura floridana]|nr:alpha-tectorin-like isoform X2 [Rhineura floridana]